MELLNLLFSPFAEFMPVITSAVERSGIVNFSFMSFLFVVAAFFLVTSVGGWVMDRIVAPAKPKA